MKPLFAIACGIPALLMIGLALEPLTDPGRPVQYGSQTYTLRTWIKSVAAAQETNTLDRSDYWVFHADLHNAEQGEAGTPLNLRYKRPSCAPTDDHEIARMVLENESAAERKGECGR